MFLALFRSQSSQIFRRTRPIRGAATISEAEHPTRARLSNPENSFSESLCRTVAWADGFEPAATERQPRSAGAVRNVSVLFSFYLEKFLCIPSIKWFGCPSRQGRARPKARPSRIEQAFGWCNRPWKRPKERKQARRRGRCDSKGTSALG